ncbi:MAG TPA: class I SAM-dependent methyltransferase [Sporichthyaceae bacterium]|nr:class I SAM-dependent methyltransferase [Sporichthyaceae bacterium]
MARLAAAGMDMHGEARYCATLLKPGARVLDAGCGTGRVAARLAELGYDCVGVDLDPSMLQFARQVPGVHWVQADLATLDLPALGVPEAFDLIVSAGNVIPLVGGAAAPAVVARLAAHLVPGGLLVSGFGLDVAHLPAGPDPVALADHDAWCAAAGLALVARHGTWDGALFEAAGGYAVSVLQRI